MANIIDPVNIWEKVLELVGKRTKFNTWSIANGWLDTEFELKINSQNKIELLATKERGARIFVPATFTSLAKSWYDYKSGKISRPELKKLSHHSSYVLPLLKLIEDGE
jgi:hypothetical protein